jgi:hypothetical protein
MQFWPICETSSTHSFFVSGWQVGSCLIAVWAVPENERTKSLQEWFNDVQWCSMMFDDVQWSPWDFMSFQEIWLDPAQSVRLLPGFVFIRLSAFEDNLHWDQSYKWNLGEIELQIMLVIGNKNIQTSNSNFNGCWVQSIPHQVRILWLSSTDCCAWSRSSHRVDLRKDCKGIYI